MQGLGLIGVGAAVLRVRLANPKANVDEHLRMLQVAADAECQIVAFPELSITGYTCADLFFHRTLLEAARTELGRLLDAATEVFSGLFVVGLPWEKDGLLFNVAAVCCRGDLLGVVPKSFLPNYQEFYERRWFTPAFDQELDVVDWRGEPVVFGPGQIFRCTDVRGLTVGVEVCEDVWAPIPPSSRQALAGATVLLNLSASNESTAKSEYRRNLVASQSGRCAAAYVYAASGSTESTTDLVFGGHGMIAENGSILAEQTRFRRDSDLLVAHIDLERLLLDRRRWTTFGDEASGASQAAGESFSLGPIEPPATLHRRVAAHPFVPDDPHRLHDRCQEIFQTQTAALAQRLEAAGPPALHIGVSGGLDSTLALLVAVKTCDLLGRSRRDVHGATMPGFGTSNQTLTNARRLMQLLEIQADEIDIRALCLDSFIAMKHRPFGMDCDGLTLQEFTEALRRLPAEHRKDLVFENVQARIRTMLLMNRGFVVGTGDLSELALGWCTYNADHMSMYNPNAGIPKTLVRFLVRYAADYEFSGEASVVLHSIADTVISPELLPIDADNQIQSTEQTIGPYELHDFFLYHLLRFGFGPEKILYLARHARFEASYSQEEIRGWLRVFFRRFFANQFKRSCLPDGPKVGSVSLSPRGDWRMPSDADVSAWLAELDATG